jgi:hypothetical protein
VVFCNNHVLSLPPGNIRPTEANLPTGSGNYITTHPLVQSPIKVLRLDQKLRNVVEIPNARAPPPQLIRESKPSTKLNQLHIPKLHIPKQLKQPRSKLWSLSQSSHNYAHKTGTNTNPVEDCISSSARKMNQPKQ